MDNLDKFMGISRNLLRDNPPMPINGLRHLESKEANGWYIWAGEYCEDSDFFERIHESHVVEKYPMLKKYLRLPSGFRFQVDNKDHEDIWSDDKLLE